MANNTHSIGFIGLGWMGSNFASRLLAAGVKLQAFDLAGEKLQALVAKGATAAAGAADVAQNCDCVLLSLRDSDTAIRVMEQELLPYARAGQIIIDLGTTKVPETKRVAELFRARGAYLLDCPVSGDPRHPVYIFGGGDQQAFEKVRPILAHIADPDHLTWCGPSGSGQIVKGVNQLSMGLVQAAWLETLSFATRQGVSAEVVAKSVGGASGWRAELASHAARIAAGEAENNDLKFAELPYFLAAAEAAGIDLPMTSALFHYCSAGERRWRDNMNRPYVSFWHMLNRK